MRSAAESQLEDASASCERWVIWCGVAVVVAVATELVIDWLEPPYKTFLRESAITSAAIALGIVGEVALGMWDSSIQTELRRRSNDKLAAALSAAAQANERAERAELELIRFRAPRSLTPEQSSRISTEIRKCGRISFGVSLSSFDEEIIDFAGQLVTCLRDDANWTLERLPAVEGRYEAELSLIIPAFVSVGKTGIGNVGIAFPKNNRDLRRAAEALFCELNAAGVVTSLMTTDDDLPLLVLIGPKT